MTRHCATILDDLAAYRDHEHPFARRLAVHWHLTRCAACREELAIMNTIGEELRASEPLGLDPALRAKLLESLPPLTDRASIATESGKQPKRITLPQLLAVGALIGVMAAVLFPLFGRARENARRLPARSNLKQLSITMAGNGRAGRRYDSDGIREDAASPKDSQSIGGPVRIAEAPPGGGPAPAPATSQLTPDHLDGQKYGLSKGRVMWPKVTAPQNSPAAGIPAAPDNANDNLPSSLRMVHREARLAVEVKLLEEQSDEANQIVVAAGGYVLNHNLTTDSEGHKTATMSIRAPVDKFDTILSRIGKLGEVKEKNITGEDITDKTSDAQQSYNIDFNDMAVKEAELQQAKQHHRNTWELENELRQLRTQAAQARARFDNLKRFGAMTTIALELREKPATPKQGGMLGAIGDTSQDAYGTFTTAARVPLNILIWLAAYSPLWLPLLIAACWWNKVYGKKS